jgi:hypothetical protein
MSFETVVVYNLDGDFLGYTIKKQGAKKLHTMNLWEDSAEDKTDLLQQMRTLSAATDIRNFWPDVRDPEVQVLLDDPTFEPVETSVTAAIDEEASDLVFGPEDPLTLVKPLLEEESHIVWKNIEVPSPAGIQARIRKACEVVAIARSEGQNI